jgi:hypothetical protein
MSFEAAIKELVIECINEVDLSDKIQEELPDFDDKIEESLKDHNFTAAIADALDDYDMDDDIEKALGNFDFSDAISDAFSYDRGVQRTLKTEVQERVDDKVSEYMDEYIQSPEFVSLVRGVVIDVLTFKSLRERLFGKVKTARASVVKFTKDQVNRFRSAA